MIKNNYTHRRRKIGGFGRFRRYIMADIFELFKQISKSAPASTVPVTHIIVGLGSPGDKYVKTRHNAGFLAIDYMCEKFGFECKRAKWNALTGEAQMGDFRVLLMKPQTYMNNSGEAVRDAAQFYKIPAENIIVLVDDTTLAPGSMRIRAKGSAGGHNGLKSIIYHLESDTFPRIRIGVGEKPHREMDLADWVLGNFSKEDIENMMPCFEACREASELIMKGKIDMAQSRCNGLKAPKKDETNG